MAESLEILEGYEDIGLSQLPDIPHILSPPLDGDGGERSSCPSHSQVQSGQLPGIGELHHHNVILLETSAQQSGSNGAHGLVELRVGHGLRLHAREVGPIRRVHDGGAIGVGFRTVIEDIQEAAIAPEACSRVAVNRLLRMQNHCHAPFCLRLPGSMPPGSMPPGGMSEACRLVPCPILILLPEFGLLELARGGLGNCLLYTSPSPRDGLLSRMPSSA